MGSRRSIFGGATWANRRGFGFNEGGRWFVLVLSRDIVYLAIATRWDNSRFFRVWRASDPPWAARLVRPWQWEHR